MFADLKRHCQIETAIEIDTLLKIGGVKKFFVDEQLRAVDVIAVNAVNFRAEIFLPYGKPRADAATDINDTARANEYRDKIFRRKVDCSNESLQKNSADPGRATE